MMTKRLYHKDSYLLDFKSEIVGLNRLSDGVEVILKETAFYPESGGQSADKGELAGFRVIDVQNGENDTIVHILEDCQFNIGDIANGVIDSSHRLSNMHKHTGQHILSQALIRVAGAETVSAHLGESDSTIEVNIGIVNLLV